MVDEIFMPSVNQSIETGVEETRVKIAEPLRKGFLNFSMSSEMTTCQVLLQRSEEKKIIWCKIRVVGRLSKTFNLKHFFKSRVNEAVYGRVFSCKTRTPFDSTPGFFCEMLCATGPAWHHNWQHSQSLHAYGNQPEAHPGGRKRL
ncbi:hypothetical protein AVEN_41699-1 [Araneus ventricosus]|uniref:Uncharacterized protein n=1 Tax=Araneus ventricosus TaxID=182803 RepID=A0A4Y2SNA6_ARAVE|nr:hypothetical protein AVEN_41699-1 [Araneus ventricosus]